MSAPPIALTQHDVDFAWACGIFEGEGYICSRYGMRYIGVQMTDKDIINRLAEVMGVGTVTGPYSKRPPAKPLHKWTVYRWSDLSPLLHRMYPLLGERRQARVHEVWLNPPKRAVPTNDRECSHGHLFDEKNTYWRSDGKRACKACNNQRARRYRAEGKVPSRRGWQKRQRERLIAARAEVDGVA